MEGTPQEEISPQTEPTSAPWPKRARTDQVATEDLSGNSRFGSSQLRTSQDSIGSLSTNSLQKTDGLITAERGQRQDEKPAAGLTSHVTPATRVASVHISRAHSESHEVCVTDSNNNTPSSPGCKQLEDEAPDSCGVCLQNDEYYGTGAQSRPGLIQAVTFCSDKGADTDLCHTFSQLTDAVQSDLKREEAHFIARKAGGSPTSSGDFRDPPPPRSNVEGDLSQNSDLQICGNVHTKGQRSKTFADCAEGSIPCYELVSGRDIAAENVSFEEHNYVRAAELPAAARISQEPAEGDNEADAFSVIDPVIWSEIDKELERLLWNSDSAAGRELPPSVCKVETTPPLCPEVGKQPNSSPERIEPLQDRRRTLQCGNENKTGCQTHTEPQARSATSSETQEQTDNEGKSSPTKPPPAGDDGTKDICKTAGRLLEEQSLSSCLAVSPGHMETPQLENSHTESHRVEEATGMKQNHPSEEIEADLLRNLEEAMKSEEKHELQNKPGGRITQKHGGRFECIDGEQENELGAAFGADVYVTAEGEEHKQEGDVRGEVNPDEREAAGMPGESEEDVENQSKPKGGIRDRSPSQDVSEWLENRLAFWNEEDPEQRLGCFAHDQHTPDISTLCIAPPTTDAVVPRQSQNALHSLRCFPSAFTPCSGVLGGFDTFEKINLSPDDVDDDATGLSALPVLSLSKRLPNTPQVEREHPVEMAESKINEKTLVDEKKERESPGCPTGHIEKGFVSSDSGCNEVPNLISQPEKEPSSGSASVSSQFSHDELNPRSSAVPSDCDSPSSDLSSSFHFEMKEQFGRVLHELNLFFEISRNKFSSDCRPSPPEPCGGLAESLEEHSSEVQLRSPGLGRYAHPSTDEAVGDHSLVMCGVDPAVSCPVIRSNGEQEVPLNRNLGQEPLVETAEKNKEPQEEKEKIWSPSFTCLPHLGQLSHRPPELPRRLEPLKTCTRPIRIGLSKRAKTKQLHHVHPYK